MSLASPSGASLTSPPEIGQKAFDRIARHLEVATGIVLSNGKKGLAVSRLGRRLRELELPDFDAYCDHLDHPGGRAELDEMVLMLTTNVTRFFREQHHFDSLRADILPQLVARARRGARVRIWSAGCSSGEEPYSIAMCVLDACPEANDLDLRVLATDIDRNMVARGRAGRYRAAPDDLAANDLMGRYLKARPGGQFDVAPELKQLVQFACLNLTEPWPMQGKFDVIFCRNVVIYFAAETQKALWPRFAQALQPGGVLMIGHSERVTGRAATILRSSGVTQYQHHPK